MAIIYIDEEKGTDAPGTLGTETAPFKSLPQAYLEHGPDNEYQVKKKDEEYKPAPKSALKKAVNFADAQRKKREAAAKRAEKEAEEKAAAEAVLAEAKKIKVTEDPSLPPAVLISLGETDPKIIGRLRKSAEETKDGVVRVRVMGRVQRVAKQGGMMFVLLRRGLEYMQCMFSGDLSKTYDSLTLTRETSMEIFGELWALPEHPDPTKKRYAPLDRELHADYYRIISKAAGGDDSFTNRVPTNGDPNTLLNLRHLALRHDKPSTVVHVRDVVEFAFHRVYKDLGVTKVSPPALVQTQVEGGATLFGLKYYDEASYLTQSSQLYLETVLPVVGDAWCLEKSFRAEKSLTRRHLSEYTHIEAELDFITFDDLLAHLEEVVCRVIDMTLEDPIAADAVEKYWAPKKDNDAETSKEEEEAGKSGPKVEKPEEEEKGWQKPIRPFMRMRYEEAIEWLNKKGIKTAEDKDHVFGDDIAEAAERQMVDTIGCPIFLTHFPVEVKAFYMQRAADDPRVTESVDLLMPGVGEIVGGSMRIWDYEELLAAYKREGLDPAPYYWYLDQRKYGGTPHGGYGIGAERFLAWLLKLWTVREACLYPRFMGRCTP